VHGIKRRSSSLNAARVNNLDVDPHIENAKLFLHYGDIRNALGTPRLL
jgi:GDPmannose 4,6-dehydratase